MRRRRSATALAAALALLAVGAVLIGWWLTGQAAVAQARQAALAEPARRAEQRARLLAEELGRELDAVRQRESRRPYFHYQNLFHDPRGATSGTAVAPSPLADGPVEPLVRAHFQVALGADAGADLVVTMPTLNDDIPALVAADRRALDEPLRSALGQVAATLVAAVPALEASPARVASVQRERSKAPRPVGVAVAPQQAETLELSADSYSQNAMSNTIYQQNYQQDRPALRPAPPVTITTVEKRSERITVTIGALDWQVVPLGDRPSLAALRRVMTPDGELVQGLVVDADALVAWLDRAEPGARLVSAASAPAPAPEHAEAGLTVGPGWRVAVATSGQAAASALAAQAARAFWWRFVPVAALAGLCGLLVVVVVARSERLAAARSQFAASAAHELRTPLAGLQLYGDMLADGLGDPGKHGQYARRIAEEAARLGRVVGNVLGFSQLERGGLSVRPAPADLAAAVRAITERQREALTRAGVTVEVTAADPVWAQLDADALDRIVVNLLDNGEKYTRGGADRRLLLRVDVDPASGHARLAVRDHGPGVAPAVRARLFTAFARGEERDGPAGLGLGLALARSLARAMGGDLGYVEPRDGDGALFVLQLPAAPAPAS
ncbi:MAG: HAMP domain-containing histidine kinase [Kofleriaceae bacterium]|nr:HAMP domain-containing histidine kinase [Kofleriaceae bacterium]